MTPVPEILELLKHDSEPPLWSIRLAPDAWVQGLTTNELYWWRKFRRRAAGLLELPEKLPRDVWLRALAGAVEHRQLVPAITVSEPAPHHHTMRYPWALVQIDGDVVLYHLEERTLDTFGIYYRGRRCTPDGDFRRRNLVQVAPFRILHRWKRLPPEGQVLSHIVERVERLRNPPDPRYRPGWVSTTEKRSA